MTELYRGLDPELYRGLVEKEAADPNAVPEALAAWAELHGRYYELERWLVNGRSRQPVAVVSETDSHTEETTMLVLKVLTAPSDSLRTLEYARHRQAELERPKFAADHLSTFVHDAVPVSPRRWITFQRIAANNLENTEVMTVLLRRMLQLTDEVEPPQAHEISCRPDTFINACRSIVAGVLGEWAGSPCTPPKVEWNPATFFGWHIFDQMEADGRLSGWAAAHDTDLIRVDGEPDPLPNPFAVARGRLLAGEVIRPLLGRSHGDLHTDNALVRVRPRVDTDDWFLIDTALYDSVGPLTRDPAHLLLYIIARSMETIAEAQQGPLIELLLDPINGPDHLVPRWLAELIQGVAAETGAWVEKSGLTPRWREQSYLSLAACAMLFLGRTSTREVDKPWFLRLAARAVARFAKERKASLDGSTCDARAIDGRIQDAPEPAAPHHDTQFDQKPPPVPEPELAPRKETSSKGSNRKKRAKYDINIVEGKGIQISDGGHQVNHFS